MAGDFEEGELREGDEEKILDESRKLDELIKKGKKKGHLLYEEVSKFFEETSFPVEDYDEVFFELERNGIELISRKELEKRAKGTKGTRGAFKRAAEDE
ncbi:MAG: RNA polymerase sigma factor region1.1 domain-containing protein, partial [Terriglobia bacterium]